MPLCRIRCPLWITSQSKRKNKKSVFTIQTCNRYGSKIIWEKVQFTKACVIIMGVSRLPQKPLRPCNYSGCKELTNSRFCPEHKKKEQRRYDKQRGTSTERGYGSNWRKVRKMVLAEEPLCRECGRQGRVTAANEVDHIDGNAFNIERVNLQPLCKPCHSKKTVREQGRWG